MYDPFETIAAVRFDEGNRELARRIRIEGKIFRKIVISALAVGYTVSLNDGDEWTVHRSSDKAEIMSAAFSTDEDIIRLFKPDGKSIGMFYLVYGNDGYDVINDYTANDELEAFYKAEIEPLIDRLEAGV